MVEAALRGIRIVLVEPAGPLNVGAIARIMKNMGLGRLVLVNPQCDVLGAEARQMAVRAGDVLESAQRVETLPDALVGCRRAIATSGRDTTLSATLEHPRTALPWLLQHSTESQSAPPESALIFGREDRGLTNEELNYAQRLIRIPSTAAYPSLNLAQAVAICCYELYMTVTNYEQMPEKSLLPHSSLSVDQSAQLSTNPISTSDLAALDRLEGYYQQLEKLLLHIGYLYPHTATSRMEKFRRIFNRAYLSEAEVMMLRGILSQVEWALTKRTVD